MSGGLFCVSGYPMEAIADDIRDYIEGHELCEESVRYRLEEEEYTDEEKEYIVKHRRTIPNRNRYDSETIQIMRQGEAILRMAAIFTERIDYLLCGDDGEDDFKERLAEDLENLRKNQNQEKEA